MRSLHLSRAGWQQMARDSSVRLTSASAAVCAVMLCAGVARRSYVEARAASGSASWLATWGRSCAASICRRSSMAARERVSSPVSKDRARARSRDCTKVIGSRSTPRPDGHSRCGGGRQAQSPCPDSRRASSPPATPDPVRSRIERVTRTASTSQSGGQRLGERWCLVGSLHRRPGQSRVVWRESPCLARRISTWSEFASRNTRYKMRSAWMSR
jgi:hypothetical protein